MLACGISVSRARIEPGSLALKARNLTHWTPREVPVYCPFEKDRVTLEAEGGVRQVSGPAGAPTSWRSEV